LRKGRGAGKLCLIVTGRILPSIMSFSLIDSHCHLDDVRFEDDRDAVLERAGTVGVEQMVVPATTSDSWPGIEVLARRYSGVFAAYGLHPMFMQHHVAGDVGSLDRWLDQNPAVAVGECGLDFFQSDTDSNEQLELFRGQLQVAANHRLPVIIHARKALDLVIRELRRSKVESGVVHSFSGSLQQAEQLHALGFKLGIAATVSFDRARRLREVVRQIDPGALLIETDAPDQPGLSHRGQRNEPAFLPDHLDVMARLRDESPAVLAETLNRNCLSLFNLPGSD
jgi:TatD DNase family protein